MTALVRQSSLSTEPGWISVLGAATPGGCCAPSLRSLHSALPRHGPVARRREELLRGDPCRGLSGLHPPTERRPRTSRRALHGRAPSHDGRARTSRSFAELDVLEPPLHDLLDELPEAQAARDDWRRGFEALRTKAQAGDAIGATRLFYELVNNQGPGALDVQPEPLRQMVLDNVRTVPLALSARPPAFSRAILNGVKAPTLVVGGHSRRLPWHGLMT